MVQYKVESPDHVYDAYYKLDNSEAQIRAYVFDTVTPRARGTRTRHAPRRAARLSHVVRRFGQVRSVLPTMNVDAAFEAKEEIALEVKNALKETMTSFGFSIMQCLVTDLNPDAKVLFHPPTRLLAKHQGAKKVEKSLPAHFPYPSRAILWCPGEGCHEPDQRVYAPARGQQGESRGREDPARQSRRGRLRRQKAQWRGRGQAAQGHRRRCVSSFPAAHLSIYWLSEPACPRVVPRLTTCCCCLGLAGLRDSILDFSGGAEGVEGTTPKDVIDLLLLTQCVSPNTVTPHPLWRHSGATLLQL